MEVMMLHRKSKKFYSLLIALIITILITPMYHVNASNIATLIFTNDYELVYENVHTNADGTVNLSDVFLGIAPGETRAKELVVRNENSRTINLYMNMEGYQTLENERLASPSGFSAYCIQLTVGARVIYDSTVGGFDPYNTGLTMIHQGHKAGYMLVATLNQGEETTIRLTIEFEGEAMGNQVLKAAGMDYSLSHGILTFDFMLSYDDVGETYTVLRVVDRIRTAPEVIRRVLSPQTGDDFNFALFALLGLSMITIITILYKKKKTKAITIARSEHEKIN